MLKFLANINLQAGRKNLLVTRHGKLLLPNEDNNSLVGHQHSALTRSNLQQKRHRPVIDQMHLHIRAEAATGHLWMLRVGLLI